jgi:hypothetical protein
MKNPNPPVNVLLGITADRFVREPEKVTMLYRDQLAERLGVAPKERVSMTLVQNDTQVVISVLIDGGDLTADQETVLRAWLQESGVTTLFSVPERPTTS